MALSAADLEAIVQATARVQAAWLPPYMLGAQLDWRQTRVVTQNTTFPVCAADPCRVLLGFGASSGATHIFTPNPGNPDVTGFVLTGTQHSPFLTVAQHGILPQLAWDCVYTGGGTYLIVLEVIWRPSWGGV